MWGFQPLLATASVGVNLPLTLGVGTFALNGQVLGLPLVAGPGIFTLSGQAMGGPPAIHSALTPEPGRFNFSGRAFNQPIAASSAVKVLTLGDSIFQYANFTQSATRIDNQADGEINWVKARGKAGFQHDNWYAADAYWIDPSAKPLFKGANHGWGGDWALNVTRRLTAVINMNPDIVVLNIGTNNGPDPLTSDAASVISQIGQIVAALAGASKPDGSGIIRLVIGTIRPRAVTATASSGLYTYEQTPAFYGRRNTINAYIRTLDNGSTVFLWDPEPDLLDPSPTAPLLAGSMYRWVTRDGVHLAPRGAYASSRTLELAIDRILGDGAAFNTDASVSNAITNGVLTGTGGTVSGVTGQAPDNTTVSIVNGATAFVSGVSSVGAGGWTFAIACTGGSSSASNVNVIRAESANITVASQGWTSGTWIKAYAEVEVSNQQVLGALHVDLLTGPTIPAANFRSQGLGPTISNRATEAFADGGWSGWIETSAQQIGTDTNVKARLDIEPYIDRAGDATVTIKRWIIRSVTDPHTIFPFDPMNPQDYRLTGQPITFDLVAAGSHPSLIADAGLFNFPLAGLSGQAVEFSLNFGVGFSPLVDDQGAYLRDDQGAILIVEGDTLAVFNNLDAETGIFTVLGTVSGSDVDLIVTRRTVYIGFGPLLRAPRKIYPGSFVAINGTFYDENGLPFNPPTVTLRIAPPFGGLRSYTYGSNPEVRKIADGRYVFDLDLDAPGRWAFQWVAVVGAITSVKQGELSVQDTPLYQFPRQRYTG